MKLVHFIFIFVICTILLAEKYYLYSAVWYILLKCRPRPKAFSHQLHLQEVIDPYWSPLYLGACRLD